MRLVVLAPIPFLLTPFLLRHVGTAGFGIWAVLLSFNGLTALADFGVMGTLTKHVSQHYTHRDYVSLNRVINAGIVMFSIIAAVCVVIMNVASGFLISVFFREASLPVLQIQESIRLLSVAIALNLLVFPFSSVISGLQRLDLTNLLWGLNAVITAVTAAIFVELGKGIPGLVDAIVLTSGVILFLNLILAWRLLPNLRFNPSLVRMADIKALSAFSLQVYVVQIATTVYFHTEKLLLAHFAGPTPVGWYEIANDLALKLSNAPALLMTPLMPAAAELEARNDDARTSELYYRAHKYLACIGIALFTVVGLMAHRFVDLWLGPGFLTNRTRPYRADRSTHHEPGRWTRIVHPDRKGNSGTCSSFRIGGYVRNASSEQYFDLIMGFHWGLVRHQCLSVGRRGLSHNHVSWGNRFFQNPAGEDLRVADAMRAFCRRTDNRPDFCEPVSLDRHDHYRTHSFRGLFRRARVATIFRRLRPAHPGTLLARA